MGGLPLLKVSSYSLDALCTAAWGFDRGTGESWRRASERGPRRKLIAEDPFAGLASSVVPAKEKQFFIPRETVTTLLDQCHGPEYRLLLIFARYMGVRIPSEIVPLKWSDVDWANSRLVITSPKTKRHKGGGKRVCPIFPEVQQALQEAWDAAPEGAVHVFPSIRSVGRKEFADVAGEGYPPLRAEAMASPLAKLQGDQGNRIGRRVPLPRRGRLAGAH